MKVSKHVIIWPLVAIILLTATFLLCARSMQQNLYTRIYSMEILGYSNEPHEIERITNQYISETKHYTRNVTISEYGQEVPWWERGAGWSQRAVIAQEETSDSCVQLTYKETLQENVDEIPEDHLHEVVCHTSTGIEIDDTTYRRATFTESLTYTTYLLYNKITEVLYK